ncbi:MAG: hypothetical protein IPQ17_05605 [Xanthomonadales bacterium]|nr:hypothetical protein [Xanthomonadales bacterium]
MFGLACGDVSQAIAGILHQQQVNAFTLQLVVIVQSLRVDDGNVALAIFVTIFSTPSFTWSASSERLALAWESEITSRAEMGITHSTGLIYVQN